MIEINARTKKWGNSLGILIPKEAVIMENLKPEEKIRIIVEKPGTKVKDIFGKLKTKKGRTTQKVLDEIDIEFEPEY